MKHVKPVSRELAKFDIPFDLQFLIDLLDAIVQKISAKETD